MINHKTTKGKEGVIAVTRNTLTDKERIFALAVADGHTQYDAYKLAYNTNTDRRQTVDTNASIVANKPEVKRYIEELRRQKEKAKLYKDINDKDRRIELIWERIEVCREKGDDAAIARYTEQLAKLNGDYIHITKDLSDNNQSEIQNLSTDELKAILGTTNDAHNNTLPQ